eukprot:6681297-Prorocentrum_lima.AAC.1
MCCGRSSNWLGLSSLPCGFARLVVPNPNVVNRVNIVTHMVGLVLACALDLSLLSCVDWSSRFGISSRWA